MEKTKAKVGFLGHLGSFSHEAADKYLTSVGGMFEVVPQDSFPKLFNFNSNGQRYLIVVPIDNSIEGLVTPVADLLVEADNFVIIGEYILSIKQNLLTLSGTNLLDIKRIYSHPQALAQCRNFIEKMRDKNKNDIKEIATKSTSEAAKIVAEEKNIFSAAIGGELSALLNHLKIMASDIADANNNQTRFLVLVKTAEDLIPQPSGDDKTFAIFSVENKPGSLVRVLEVFDVLSVNMTMIQSRPSKKQLGEYVFFVEFEGHRASSNIAVALDGVRSRSVWLKVLGSYPIFKK